jgi:TonB family protein
MNWLYYLAEANLYLGVFYLAYCLFLRNETHYQLNRAYLLGICVVAFVLPVLQIGALKPVDIAMSAPLNNTTNVVAVQGSYMAASQIMTGNEFTVKAQSNSTSAAPPIVKTPLTLQDYLLYAYLAGAGIFALLLIIKLFALYKLTQRGQEAQHDGHTVIYVEENNVAFSFFNYLFIGKRTEGMSIIIRHEQVHIRQKHSVDIVYLEILKIINWFNPFIYLIQISLRTLHEYIADEQTAANETDNLSYSSFLLSNAYGISGSSITHSFFNYNLTKKRIIMLNQRRSGSLARLKYLIAVPVCAGLLCVSSLAISKTYGWVDLNPAEKSLNKTMHERTTSVVGQIKLSDTDNGDIAKSGAKFEPESTSLSVTQPNEDHPPVPMQSAGGYDKLNRYLLKNIHFKPADGDKGGLVVVSFTVGAGRKVTNLQLATSDGEVLDNLALNAFKSYNGIVNDDEGKTLKFGVFFLTDDYSIFKRPYENDRDNSGWVTVTKYGYRPAATSKGYEYNEWFTGGIIMNGEMKPTVTRVRFYDKNDQETTYSADSATPAEVKLLKDKYGYVFPSNAYWASESIKDMKAHKYVPSGMNIYSYLNKPYTESFYGHIFNELEYPEQEKNDGIPGSVLLKFNLDVNGTAGDWAIAKSGGENFDKAALDVVKSYNGTINDKAGAHTIAMVFCTVQNGKRPKVDDNWKKTPGYVGEVARGESKPITISISLPKKQ